MCHINITFDCDTTSNVHISNWFRQAINNNLYFCSSLEMFSFTSGCRPNDHLTQAITHFYPRLSPQSKLSVWMNVELYAGCKLHIEYECTLYLCQCASDHPPLCQCWHPCLRLPTPGVMCNVLLLWVTDPNSVHNYNSTFIQTDNFDRGKSLG